MTCAFAFKKVKYCRQWWDFQGSRMKGNVFALSPHRINTGGQNWANLLIQWLSFLRTSYLSSLPKFYTTKSKSKIFKTLTNTTLPPYIQCTIQAPPIALIASTPKPFQCVRPLAGWVWPVPSHMCHLTCTITAIAQDAHVPSLPSLCYVIWSSSHTPTYYAKYATERSAQVYCVLAHPVPAV